jgi:hypothetical protein
VFKLTYNQSRIDKHLSDAFLKQRDALSRLLLNCVLKYAIRKVKENQVRLNLTGLLQLLVYAHVVNVLAKKEIVRT